MFVFIYNICYITQLEFAYINLAKLTSEKPTDRVVLNSNKEMPALTITDYCPNFSIFGKHIQ